MKLQCTCGGTYYETRHGHKCCWHCRHPRRVRRWYSSVTAVQGRGLCKCGRKFNKTSKGYRCCWRCRAGLAPPTPAARHCILCGRDLPQRISGSGGRNRLRCRDCRHRRPKKARCTDCGTPIGLNSLRCNECYRQHVRRPPRNCINCSREFTGRKGRYCCSNKCARARLELSAAKQRRSDTSERLRARRRRASAKRRLAGAVYTVGRWRRICERDNWLCWLCGGPVEPSLHPPDRRAGSVDHVIPLSRGGDEDESNLRAAHFGCNSKRCAGRWNGWQDAALSLHS